MPINKKMMASMKKQYGKKTGERVYYAVEAKQKATAKKGKKK
jgi:hypothetical protein